MMILFVLALAAADPQPLPTPSPNAADKIVCKQFAETGSLVRTEKICKTRRQWDIDRANIRATGPGADSCRTAGSGVGC